MLTKQNIQRLQKIYDELDEILSEAKQNLPKNYSTNVGFRNGYLVNVVDRIADAHIKIYACLRDVKAYMPPEEDRSESRPISTGVLGPLASTKTEQAEEADPMIEMSQQISEMYQRKNGK